MRVSKYYSLGRKQYGLDFVDVDIETDIPVYIDPKGVELYPSEWGDRCVSLIHDFFSTVLMHIKNNDNKAIALLKVLREPNEIHLGLSKGKSRGRGLGTKYAEKIWSSLSKSKAVKTGLLQDLEDMILMIYGVGSDLISDISANIIRGALIEYTQGQCALHDIPMIDDVDSGPLWNPISKLWFSELVKLPMPNNQKLILVPKSIVRLSINYEANHYYRHYLLEHLKASEYEANSNLVHLLKNGKSRVYIKDLKEKYGTGKKAIVELSDKYPEVFEKYKKDTLNTRARPVYHDHLAFGETNLNIDWDILLNNVLNLSAGKNNAKKYEKAVEELLTALFYPSLANPKPQAPLHDGLKYVDIRYTNIARDGFFYWVANHYTAPNIWIECKNYKGDISNPEVDQLLGRFSESRGVVGFILCRTIANKKRALKRCKVLVSDAKRYIVLIDDDDLNILVESKKLYEKNERFTHLHNKFQEIIC